MNLKRMLAILLSLALIAALLAGCAGKSDAPSETVQEPEVTEAASPEPEQTPETDDAEPAEEPVEQVSPDMIFEHNTLAEIFKTHTSAMYTYESSKGDNSVLYFYPDGLGISGEEVDIYSPYFEASYHSYRANDDISGVFCNYSGESYGEPNYNINICPTSDFNTRLDQDWQAKVKNICEDMQKSGAVFETSIRDGMPVTTGRCPYSDYEAEMLAQMLGSEAKPNDEIELSLAFDPQTYLLTEAIVQYYAEGEATDRNAYVYAYDTEYQPEVIAADKMLSVPNSCHLTVIMDPDEAEEKTLEYDIIRGCYLSFSYTSRKNLYLDKSFQDPMGTVLYPDHTNAGQLTVYLQERP